MDILNKLQEQAVHCADDKIVITAPPGSGKTRTMVAAIDYYKTLYPESRITAITFTRKAAAELNLKLYDHPDVVTATIHSWSLKELNKLGAKHNITISILNEEQIMEILHLVCIRLGYYSINYYYLKAYIMGNYNIDVSQGQKMKFEKILRNYVDFKRGNGLYDFTDLPLYLFDMLNAFDEEIDTIDGLFVDEYQDVDDVQAQIFTKVNAKKHFYIGDPDQSIYQFRGASKDVLNNLQGFTHLTLDINYRSYQNIIDFSTYVLTSDPFEVHSLSDSWIKAARTDDKGQVFVITGNSTVDLSSGKDVDANNVLMNFFELHPYILCRSNRQVKEIQALGYSSVSTVHQAKGLEYANVIVVYFLNDTEEETNIMYVACSRAQNGLIVIDYETLINYLQESEMQFASHDLF